MSFKLGKDGKIDQTQNDRLPLIILFTEYQTFSHKTRDL